VASSPGPHRRMHPKDPGHHPALPLSEIGPGPGSDLRGPRLGHGDKDPITLLQGLHLQDGRSQSYQIPGVPEPAGDHPGERGPDHGVGQIPAGRGKFGLKGAQGSLGPFKSGLRILKGLPGNGPVFVKHPVALEGVFAGQVCGLRRGHLFRGLQYGPAVRDRRCGPAPRPFSPGPPRTSAPRGGSPKDGKTAGRKGGGGSGPDNAP